MIEVKNLLPMFEKLLEQGADLNEYVLLDKSDGELPPNTEFIVMRTKDFIRAKNGGKIL